MALLEWPSLFSFLGRGRAAILQSMNTPLMHCGSCRGVAALLMGIAFLGLSPGPINPAPAGGPAARRTALGPNLFFEVEGKRRRVVIRAHVCLRQGQLEGLLCRK